jgi:hypothetical protein
MMHNQSRILHRRARIRGILIAAVATCSAIALLNPSSCHADAPLTRTFENTEHGFSISLPSDWAPLTLQRLEQVNHVVHDMHPEWTTPLIQYAYEMTTNTPEMSFRPLLVIRVAYSPSEPDPKAVREDLELRDLPKGVEKSEPVFDPELDAWLVQCKVRPTNAPPIDAFITCYLAKTNVVKMFLYAPHGTDHPFAGLAQQIFRGVRIAPENKIFHEPPPSPKGAVAAMVAMVVIVVVLSRRQEAKPQEFPADSKPT